MAITIDLVSLKKWGFSSVDDGWKTDNDGFEYYNPRDKRTGRSRNGYRPSYHASNRDDGQYKGGRYERGEGSNVLHYSFDELLQYYHESDIPENLKGKAHVLFLVFIHA